MRFKFKLMMIAFLLFANIGFSLDIDEYISLCKIKNNAKIFELAKSVIRDDSDEKVKKEALKDLLYFSKIYGKNNEIVEIIDKHLTSKTFDTELSRYSRLVKGRLLIRNGNVNEASKIFNEEINDANPEAFVFYIDSLSESHYHERAILEKLRISLNEDVISNDWYNFLPFFYIPLVKYKQSHPGQVLSDKFEESLLTYTNQEVYKSLMVSLLSLADKKYHQSMERLSQIENIQGDTYVFRDIPLYKSLIIIHQSYDQQLIENNLEVFFHNNTDRPEYCLRMTMELCHIIEMNHPIDYNKIYDITKILVDNGYGDSKKYYNALTDEYWLAHLLDLYQTSMYKLGKVNESQHIRIDLVNTYFPQNYAGINAMYVMALVNMQDGNFQDAESNLLRLIYETNDNKIIRKAKKHLLKVWIKMKKPRHEILGLITELNEGASKAEKDYYGKIAGKLLND